MVGGLKLPGEKTGSNPSLGKSEKNHHSCSRVSIIIAARNNERYLAETIESSLQQSIPCEVIYSDDNSIDDSLELARQYQSQGLTVLESPRHQGVCETRNRGAAASSGDYLVFLDGDDIMPPNYIEEHLKVMRDDTPFVYGPAQAFGDFSIFWDAPEWEGSDIWRNNFVNTSAMWRRKVFEVAGRWREGIKTMWDWDLALRGSRLGVPRRSNATLKYRQHAASWSANNREKTHDQQEAFMPEVRKLNARVAVGSIISGRISKLFPAWMSAVAQATRLLDNSSKPELVLLDNSNDPDFRITIEKEVSRYWSTFQTIRIIPLEHRVSHNCQSEEERRDAVSRFMAHACNQLRTHMDGEIHWIIEDDIMVPIQAGADLMQALVSGWTPPNAVSGCYHNRHIPKLYVGGWWNEDAPHEITDLPADPFQVDYAGTGCLMYWNSRTPRYWGSHHAGIPAHDWNWSMELTGSGGQLLMLPQVCCQHAIDDSSFV
ncbi:glycosyltransferase family 2 protein [Gimesia chilikensis]|uniref:glycosyltransferase family 2 protein n=1 Tax=Gimesia chilikensis TaxID=2605989 RepID=UPI00118BEB9F|nr:glycosyltransferase family A protein [Gimesia chilikensis]QDT86428.1 Putative glycosyltransferase EpsE [Gimesia chilikensis]